jgi:hypothetical protein
MSRQKLTLQMFYARRVLWIFLISFVFFLALCLVFNEFYTETPSLLQILNASIPATAESSISRQLKYISKHDFNKLIDVENFEFLLNHPSCVELQVQPKVVILVHSAPGGFQKRQVIRDTWGQYNPNSLLLFLVGTVNSTEGQQRIKNEYDVSVLKFHVISTC